MLEVGTKAPDFTLPDQDGNMVSLQSFKGQKVVLYFYPKDNTPGCTNFEMEASTLLTLCSVHGLRAGAICGVVAKRTDSESVAPPGVYKKAEQRFQKVAKRALEKLIAADKV